MVDAVSTGTNRQSTNPRTAGFAPLARNVLPPILVIAGLLVVWELAFAADLLPITVPSPTQVWAAFLTEWDDLFYHASSTIRSAAIGYLCAALVAAALAAFAVSWPRAERGVFTFGILVDSTPLIAVAPIFMIWLGNGITLHVVTAAIAGLFPMLVGLIQGFKSADPTSRELFHVLSATRWQVLTRLALPSALPFIFSALKIAAPLALLGTLIAEWMGTDRGLGTMIIYALFSFNVPLVWVGIIAVSAITAVSYGIVALAEDRIVVWHRSSSDLGAER
ncbi:MAG: ABC transporter permease [Pseudomonadota bacterium]